MGKGVTRGVNNEGKYCVGGGGKLGNGVVVAEYLGVDVTGGFTLGVSVCAVCVDAVPHAERVRLIAKIREKSFFIVHLVDGIILPSDHRQWTMVNRLWSIISSKRNP